MNEISHESYGDAPGGGQNIEVLAWRERACTFVTLDETLYLLDGDFAEEMLALTSANAKKFLPYIKPNVSLSGENSD